MIRAYILNHQVGKKWEW